jgi:hypothetical protein
MLIVGCCTGGEVSLGGNVLPAEFRILLVVDQEPRELL